MNDHISDLCTLEAALDNANERADKAEAECERLRDQLGQMQTECNKSWKRAEQAEFELALLRGRDG